MSAAPPHHHDHAEHGHGHSHGGIDPALLRSREAMRTLWLSLAILGATAALQLAVVLVSGSVALLADTVHNIGDAITALPLAAAFLLGRRPPTRTLTYGYGRAEDLAGVAVVLIILSSAAFAAYESVDRLLHPHAPDYLVATALAGVIGFLGNEWVAVYRIRAGRRLGSAALEADGHHARVDGFTSLAVVAGVLGVAAGFPAADPIVGLLITAAILRIVCQSARVIGLRALDGVEPEIIDGVERAATQVPGVLGVERVRARWLGHVVSAELTLELAGDHSVREASAVAGAVRDRILHDVEHVTQASIEVRAPGQAIVALPQPSSFSSNG